MSDITKGYFSSHTLNINNLNSLQDEPENFNANLSMLDKVIDFIRMICCLETKEHALCELNELLHKNHLVNNPVELLNVFEKILPEDVKNNIVFTFHYENSERKLEKIEIGYDDKLLEINPDLCWLTPRDEKIIKNSKLDVVELFNKKDYGILCAEIDDTQKKAMPTNGGGRALIGVINRELDIILDSCPNKSENDKLNFNAKIMVNIKNEEAKAEKLILTYKGHSVLEIPIKEGEREIVETVNNKNFNVKHYYTSCPYYEMKTLFETIDGNMDLILSKAKFNKREERFNFICEVYNVFRAIGTKAESIENKPINIKECITNALAVTKHLQNNEVDDEFDSQQVEQIKYHLNLIKHCMISHVSQLETDPENKINYVDIIINELNYKYSILAKNEEDFDGKEKESERVKESILNVIKLREYCQRSLTPK
ncbi:hypothetical protein DJ61_2722 [Yersinia enterocolitica]|uniref:hypothetical protein n=1 Tax=Yersinia enterocolitica TaxID=630 RepID=UPI00050239AB|nr:hypothetical protein [Yersinia enterocolitica]KGA68709.1 hypothetical protein DJ61_2722 [Yersinia enterocolitica]